MQMWAPTLSSCWEFGAIFWVSAMANTFVIYTMHIVVINETSGSGDFYVDNNNDNNMIDYFTPCAYAWGRNSTARPGRLLP